MVAWASDDDEEGFLVATESSRMASAETFGSGMPRLPATSLMNSNPGLALGTMLRHGVTCLFLFCVMVGLPAWSLTSHLSQHHANSVGGIVVPKMLQALQRKTEITMQYCSYREMPLCPSSELFHSPEVHRIIAENINRSSQGILDPSDNSIVHGLVVEGMMNISRHLRLAAPELMQQLNMLQLNRELQDAVLSCLRIVGDPRVQRIGGDVATALQSSLSKRREELVSRIDLELFSRLEEVQKLRMELMPTALLELSGPAHEWAFTLDASRLHVMRAIHDGKINFAKDAVVLQEMSDDANGPSYNAKAVAILGGVLEQAQALMNAIRLSARLFDRQLQLPITTWSALGDGRFAAIDPQALSAACLFGLAPKVNGGTLPACHLQLGDLGLDALRALGAPLYH
mmetsp:Transcript_59132/g.117138  ORF Transcript_59132/g.117138 Transcript_59132/m.117138 type:complete len:401 (+) Transcript_59132:71-1273(+)